MAGDAVKAAALLFTAALLQVTIFPSFRLFGGVPDVLLVTLVAVSLLRGSTFGAFGGFFAGIVVDTANLTTLGTTSLLLTLVGYWAGRYGETSVRDAARAPLAVVAAATAVYAIGGLALDFMLGDETAARQVLVDALLPGLALNLLLVPPVFALAGRLLVPLEKRPERSKEVQLLG